MTVNTQKQVIELIKRSKKILILPSAPLDGDSLGSAISLYLALKKLQKEVTVICSEHIPEVLQFLPNIKVISNRMISSGDFIITIDAKNIKIDNIKSENEDGKINIIVTPKDGRLSEENISFSAGGIDYDLIITVDTAELTQLRDVYEKNIEIFHQVPVINIDHHISNSHFGKLNFVDIMASSTTEIILPILEELASDENINLIDEDIATLLLAGIITDTGSFQNANTTPKAFARAAQLISYGARQQEIIQHVYKTKQLSQLKLWGRVLSKIQVDEKHRIVWSAVSRQDFKDTESLDEQTGDIIDELMTNAPGAEVILLLKEKEDGAISASVRTTNPSVDAAKIAENFGGGGHNQAAGFRVSNMSLMDAEYKIINFLKEFQEERLGVIAEREESKIIDVEGLMNQAKEAEKAQEMFNTAVLPQAVEEQEEEKAPKKKTKSEEKEQTPKKEFNPKPPKEKSTSGVAYRFED